MPGTIVEYFPTYEDAKNAQRNYTISCGDSFEFAMISPPNHDRATYKLEVNYDASMYQPSRRVSQHRAVL